MGSLSVSAFAPSQDRPIAPYTSSEPEPTASDEAHASGRAPVIQRLPPMSYTDAPPPRGPPQVPSDSRPDVSGQSRQQESSKGYGIRKDLSRSSNEPESVKRRGTGDPQPTGEESMLNPHPNVGEELKRRRESRPPKVPLPGGPLRTQESPEPRHGRQESPPPPPPKPGSRGRRGGGKK